MSLRIVQLHLVGANGARKVHDVNCLVSGRVRINKMSFPLVTDEDKQEHTRTLEN